ncbi:hypothetical protein B0T25DRAFT_320820 [Lasiosphaeria hispida]|uniref:C2H2-type domain-containing protein n=1 Tax=Lasiosphaeria hispida TaxID=260671 RepID=A0AAJ0H9F1_9PEZI|nr:hypothetical protein B0T25DRAFT_320820 [Lasiosphaeria hispida]
MISFSSRLWSLQFYPFFVILLFALVCSFTHYFPHTAALWILQGLSVGLASMAPSPSQAVASSPLFVGNPPGHRSVDGLGRSDAGHGERTRPRHHTLETGAGVDALGQPLSNFHVSPQHHVSSQHQDTTFTGDDPLHSITGVGMGPDADLRRMRRRGRQHDKSETPRLACPYYKMNPQRYHDCSGYVLRRVKDIKQHIYRRHMKPDIYCVRCYRPFSTEECKVKHSRGARACKVRDDPHAECISDRQRKNLHQYLSRGKPVEDQWIDMWKIIFPGRSPPRSVYLDNQQHGRAQLLRRLWSAQGPEIISQVVRDTSSQTIAYPG